MNLRTREWIHSIQVRKLEDCSRSVEEQEHGNSRRFVGWTSEGESVAWSTVVASRYPVWLNKNKNHPLSNYKYLIGAWEEKEEEEDEWNWSWEKGNFRCFHELIDDEIMWLGGRFNILISISEFTNTVA